jgi:hypothetical protein
MKRFYMYLLLCAVLLIAATFTSGQKADELERFCNSEQVKLCFQDNERQLSKAQETDYGQRCNIMQRFVRCYDVSFELLYSPHKSQPTDFGFFFLEL